MSDMIEMIFIIDRSGSMATLSKGVVQAFNEFLHRQKKNAGEVLLTIWLFNHKLQLFHDRTPLKELQPMKEREYQASGRTALSDAIGTALERISLIHQYAREEDKPKHTLIIIITDGRENASIRFIPEKVREQIVKIRSADKTDILLFAANIDAVETGEQYGIGELFAVNFIPDMKGIEAVYTATDKVLKILQGSIPLTSSEWRYDADRDFQNKNRGF